MPKEHLSRLPSFPEHDLVWDDDNKDAIILLPIFYAHPSWFPTYLTRSSRWVRQSFAVNTNVVEQKIPVKWFIEREWWNNYVSDEKPDESQCIFFDAKPRDPEIVRNRISKSLYALNHPELQVYKQVIIWDCDLFVCRNPVFDPLDVQTLLADNPTQFFLLRWDSRYLNTYKQKRWWWEKFRLRYPENIENDFQAMRKRMNRVLPHSKQIAGSNAMFPSISGGVKRYSPKHLSRDFVDFTLLAEPIIADEENILHLWHRISGQEFRTENLVVAWTTADMLKSRKNSVYFLHIYLDGTEPSDWEPQFHQDAGIQI